MLPRSALTNTPNLTRDAVLRAIPSVGTFRRSSSLSADPSAQGLSLRGVAPSGVSRALLLVDGVPASDPFAGSIYYRALPRFGVDRVEIVTGGGSALYGSSALSGVVQFLSRPTVLTSYQADLSYGSAHTAALGGYASGGREQASGAVEGEWLRSDGFPVVSQKDRGAIDARAATQHGTLIVRGETKVASRLRLSSSLSLFREELRHATRYTSAAAQLGIASLRARYDAGGRGRWDVLLFGRLAAFDQQRARVLDEREREQRAARQHVPAADQGGSVVWSSPKPKGLLGNRLALGVDARHVWGSSREQHYPPQPGPGSVVHRTAGGEQALVGAFAEDVYRACDKFQIEGALRYDMSRNYHGARRIERLGSGATDAQFEPLTYHAVNPRLGLVLTPSSSVTFRASAYRSFRTATLNELYRPFQVGTVLTAANEHLAPEYLLGGELGIAWHAWHQLTIQTTGFWNRLDDPIISATLARALPDGSLRQRRNLSRARVAGMEVNLSAQVTSHLQLGVGYTWVDARVTKQGGLPGLRGKRLPQDPAHRVSATLTFDDADLFTVVLQVRTLGRQFEDDLNTLPMKGYAVVDAMLARRLFWHLELFAAVDNLLNQSYLVGRAGVDTVGSPFLGRIGLRIRE